ncbi:MAG TPA: dephospho-CoA kinase [Anaerolineales bacterium]|nr:dephospho-CoA kinase [Anaerolineales bacterium]
MSAEKTIIGLTGNIGSGKSVVRRMLQHLGAFGIDADNLTHLAMSPGAPAYAPIIRLFGTWVVGEDKQILRKRLGKLVFADPQALQALEGILHPIVRQATRMLVERANQAVVVIEAIKLLDGDLVNLCDSVWVVDAGEKVRIQRLVEQRQFTLEDARQRVYAQSPQAEKLRRADVVIHNDGDLAQTWSQVQSAWHALHQPAPSASRSQSTTPQALAPIEAPTIGESGIMVRRGSAADSQAIAEFLSTPGKPLTAKQVLASFGSQAYLLASLGDTLLGVLGWRVENLIARVGSVSLAETADAWRVLPLLWAHLEGRAHELQAEVVLMALNEKAAHQWQEIANKAGYLAQPIAEMDVLLWREVAKELVSESGEHTPNIFCKKLREKRVLRPI